MKLKMKVKGGQSGRERPVPIPNTAVKSASVTGGTGVRDSLGVRCRRLFIHIRMSIDVN